MPHSYKKAKGNSYPNLQIENTFIAQALDAPSKLKKERITK